MKLIRNVVITAFFATFGLCADLPLIQSYGLYNAVENPYKHISPFQGLVAAENNVFRYYYDFTLEQEPLHTMLHALFRLIDDKLRPQASDREITSFLGAREIGIILATIEKHLDSSSGIITVTPAELQKQLLEVLKTFKMKSGIKAHQKESFAGLIVAALKEAGHWGTEGQKYPQFVVHDLWLMFLYNNVTEKSQYDMYFKQFAALNNGHGILKPESDTILSKSYENPADPTTLANTIIAKKNLIPFDQLALYLSEHYESVAYATIKKKYGGLYPPRLMYGKVLLPWFSNNEILKKHAKTINLQNFPFPFSNCMETAVLNLIIFIAYSAQTSTLNPIIPFFKQFPIESIVSPAAQTAWVELISDIPGVEYNRRVIVTEVNEHPVITIEKSSVVQGKPFVRPLENDGWYYYELEPTLPNIVTIVNKLFNLKLHTFGEFLTHFNLQCGSYKGEEKEQRKTMCAITDTDKRTCTLSISPGHGEIENYPVVPSQSLTEEFNAIATMLFSNDSHSLSLVNLYKPEISFIDFKKLVQTAYLRHILLIQPLSIKLQTLCFVGLELSQVKDPWLNSYVKKVLDSLFALNDPHTTSTALKDWACFALSSHTFSEFKNKLEQEFQDIDSREKIFKNLLLHLTHDTKQTANDFVLSSISKLTSHDQNTIFSGLTESADLYSKNPEFIHALLNIWAESSFATPNDNAGFHDLLNAMDTLKVPQQVAQSIIMLIVPKIRALTNEKSRSFELAVLLRIDFLSLLGVDFVSKIVSESLPSIHDPYKQKLQELLDFDKSDKNSYQAKLFEWYYFLSQESESQ